MRGRFVAKIGRGRMPKNHRLKNIVVVIAQSLLGGVAWYCVFGVLFTRPLTIGVCAATVGVSSLGAFILSWFWVRFLALPIYLPALAYSFIFWGWAIFAASGGISLGGLLMWFGMAAAVCVFGLLGGWVAFQTERLGGVSLPATVLGEQPDECD